MTGLKWYPYTAEMRRVTEFREKMDPGDGMLYDALARVLALAEKGIAAQNQDAAIHKMECRQRDDAEYLRFLLREIESDPQRKRLTNDIERLQAEVATLKSVHEIIRSIEYRRQNENPHA